MPQINQELLTKLTAKLGVHKARVYARIQQIANNRMLDRHHAALVLAAEQNINIQKYSSPQDRAALRAALSSVDRNGAVEAPTPHSPNRPNVVSERKSFLSLREQKTTPSSLYTDVTKG